MKPGTTAVIFVSKRTDVDAEGYAIAAARMESAAKSFPGYCGIP